MRFRWFAEIARAAEDGAGAADAPIVDTPAPETQAADEPAVDPALGEGGTLLTAKPEEKGAGEGEKEPAPEPEKTEEKPEEPAPFDPKDYKIELPEGIEQDDELLSAFLDGAAKGRMDNESVQAVVSALAPKLAERIAEPLNAWRTLNDQWVQQTREHPEIGGAKWDATLNTVRAGIGLVMSPEEVKAVQDAMDMTGAGNNPHVVLLLHRLASRLTEQGAVTGGAPADAHARALAALYPSAAKGG